MGLMIWRHFEKSAVAENGHRLNIDAARMPLTGKVVL
jgi:hypothetical protein